MTVHWAEPPPLKGPEHPLAVYMERLRPLLDHPERWALIASGTRSAMYSTREALRLRRFHIPPGEWEFTVREYRRGVHVGPRSMAQLYARFMGGDDNLGEAGVMAVDGVWNDEGERICPECGEVLTRPDVPHPGPWGKRCDDCWAKTGSKWARRKARRREAASG